MKLRDITALIEDEYTTIQAGTYSAESVDSVDGVAEATQLVGDDTVSLDQNDSVENVESVGLVRKANVGPPVAVNAVLPPTVPITLSTKSTESPVGSDTSLPSEVLVAADASTGGADKAGHLAQLVLGQINHLGLTPMRLSRVRGLAGEIVAGRHIDVFYLELVRSLKTGNADAMALGHQLDATWATPGLVTITNWREGVPNRHTDNEYEKGDQQ